MNFIKKIFIREYNKDVHNQLIRYGRGEYKKRALIGLWKTKNVKIKSSFEFANDFVLFVSELDDVKFYGNILSKNEISSLSKGIKKQGKWVYSVKDISSEEVKKISNEVYYYLLNVNNPGIKLKIKSRLPKPGKGEDKVDDKFCELEVDEKYFNRIKNDFFWDLPECKKAQISHTFVINELIIPNELKKSNDFAKIREEAKRKGKVIREIDCDGQKLKFEKDFEV